MEGESLGKIILALLLTFVLVYINGKLASAEIAMVGLNEAKLRKRAEAGDKKAAAQLEMKKNPSGFLSTIQVGITLAGLLSGAVAADTLSQPFINWMERLGVTGFWLGVISMATVALITLILTYIMLVFGELVPKRIAMAQPEKTANKIISPIMKLSKITKPLVRLLSVSTNKVLKMSGINPDAQEETVTEEEILLMVQEGRQQGVIMEYEAALVSNSLKFADMTAEDIMVHRREVSGIEIGCDIKNIIEIMERDPHTVYPVYSDSLDNIAGIINTRDLFSMSHKGEGTNWEHIKTIIKPVYYVSETKPIMELFNEMKMNKQHFAVAVDDYGGTSGIITIMDIIQEIVGDIDIDRSDEYTEQVSEDNSGKSFIMDGLMEMEDVIEILDLDIETETNDTLSGFIIDLLGYIPKQNDNPEIIFQNYLFKVEETENAYISKISVQEQKAVKSINE